MRRLLMVLIAATVLPAGVAVADHDVGCGFGTQIMEGNEGIPAKLVASFTNGLTFQSISITFGIVNCNGRNTVTIGSIDGARVQHYASTNFDGLAEDMASGQGERLDVLAHLLGVTPADRDAFRSLTQEQFETLYPHDSVTVGEMLSALDRVLSEDMALSAYARS